MRMNRALVVAEIMRVVRRSGKLLLYYLSDPRNIAATETVGLTRDGVRHRCLRENQIERSILETGCWEPLETNAVKRILRAGCVAFDIGANIGYFTLLMSKLVGPSGQVHCFEPTAYAFRRMQENIDLNPTLPRQNLVLNNKGLSSQSESKVEALESRFSSRLLAHDEKELIEFITLDDYVRTRELGRIDFIKIDVDGYDHEVIKGGVEMLRTLRPVVMAEICNRVLKERGVDFEEYLALYIECGYRRCELLETGEIISLDLATHDSRLEGGSWNVLLT